MAKDNTLGAPTEGLGQTVTFTASGGVGVPQLQIPDRGAVRMGMQGGAPTSSGQARQVQAAQPDPTMAALMKLGGNLLAPAVKREQDAQFMQGMQRAAQGEAVKEIVDEQPWFSKIFGATSLVDGARTYTAASKAASIATDLDSRMPEIAKMPGQQFAGYINDLLDKSATGDGATDAIVRQQFMSQMPDVMKRQARSHFLYQQEQLVEANRAYVGTAFAGLATADAMARNSGEGVGENGSIPRSVTDEGDVLTAGIKALEVFNVPEGMDPKVHSKVLTSEVIQSVNNGSFAVVNMLEKSGAMGRFEPEQASAIRSAVNAKRSQIRAELPVEFATVLSKATEIASQASSTQEDVLAQIDQINKAYAKMTGDEKPYVTAQGATSLLQALYREQQQEVEQAKRAAKSATTGAAKAAAEQEINLKIVGALVTGSPVNFASAPERRQAWATIAATKPQEVFDVRARNYATTKDDDFADDLRNSATIAVTAGNGATMYDVWQRMYNPLIKAGGDNGDAAAVAYAGDHAGVLNAFHQYMKNMPNPTQTQIDVAYAAAIVPKAKEPTKKETAVAKELTTGTLGAIWAMFPNDDIAINDPARLARMLAPSVPDGVDLSDGVKAARANNKDINVMGGFHWKRGQNQADLVTFFEKTHNVASDQRNRAVKMGVDTVAKENGLDTVTSVIQVGNTNDGKPQLVVMGSMANGDPAFALLPANRIEDLWVNRDKTKAKEVPMADPRKVGKSALEVANERFRKEQTK